MRALLLLTLLLVGVCSEEPLPSVVTTSPTATHSDVLLEPPRKCFHRPAEDCPTISANQTSLCKNVNDGVICCHLTKMFQLKEGLALAAKNVSTIKSLHIRNATFLELNVTDFDYLRIENFTMSDGFVNRINGHFPSSITCLNLSDNALDVIDENALSSLSDLTILDVSQNNLTLVPQISRLPSNTIRANTDFWLDISGTNKMQCQNMKKLIEQMSYEHRHLQFSRENDTFCYTSGNFVWFSALLKLSIMHVKALVDVIDKCPNETTYKCNCSIDKSIAQLKVSTLPVIVDCSGQGLTELPKELPLNTVALNVSNNKITSLHRLVYDPSYNNIVEFYADNNLISSISILETSTFLKTFDVLSLSHNKIRNIPTYILSNAFDHQYIKQFHVKLGYNKLECNCNTAQVVKVWLVAYKKHIDDFEDILCDDMMGKVQDLDKDQVCVDQRSWTYYIYYIIGAEVALLLLLIVKVSYDYWVFKTAGYLPWPASKMPKLPCDWFFES